MGSLTEEGATAANAGRAGRILHFVPEYGPIDAVLGFVLFAVLVETGTAVAVTAASDAGIGIGAATIRFAGAAVLWVILALTVLGQAIEQVRDNPHRFPDRQAAATYVQAMAPSRLRLRTWAVLVVFGAAIAVLGFDRFLESFRTLLQWGILTLGARGPQPIRIGAVAWFVAYSIGYSLFTRYTDRILLGLYRRRLANRYRTA